MVLIKYTFSQYLEHSKNKHTQSTQNIHAILETQLISKYTVLKLSKLTPQKI